MGEALERAATAAVRTVVPWKCSCGAEAAEKPFVLPKNWVLQRDEVGTGQVRTVCHERVLCKACAARERRRRVRRR